MSAGAGRQAGIPEISPASHSAEEKKPIRKLHFLKGLSFRGAAPAASCIGTISIASEQDLQFAIFCPCRIIALMPQ